MRSDQVKKGIQRAPHRSLLHACGVKNEDFGKPFIGIANAYCEVVPGHIHLRMVADMVKEKIRELGGIPFEFNTMAICDGIAMGHSGMKYSLPSREIIADTVESMVNAHKFDALFCIPNCDKIVPGMHMGAARVNVPTIFASGGPMLAGAERNGVKTDLITVFETVAEEKVGNATVDEVESMVETACPGAGSCSGMFTANSMNCLTEALGMALPGNGTIPAVDKAREAHWKNSAVALMDLLKNDIKYLDIVNDAAFSNALTLDVAMGGSTNTVLHTLAIAHEAGVKLDMQMMSEISKRTPTLSKISPASEWHIEDLNVAGGIMAIMKELRRKDGMIIEDAKTVSGKTIGEQLDEAECKDCCS